MKEIIKQSILELSPLAPHSFHELVGQLEKRGLPARGSQILYIEKTMLVWTNVSHALRDAVLELIHETKVDPHALD